MFDSGYDETCQVWSVVTHRRTLRGPRWKKRLMTQSGSLRVSCMGWVRMR